jgi:transposase-like protein
MVCPGCGSKFSPLAAGLTPEDLLSRESAMDGLRVPITVRCPHCPASMAGAPILDGKVRCKQCGEHYSVTRLNLSHADFLRGRILDAMDGLAWPCNHPCPRCRYSTKGLLVTGGCVRCPECNLETAVRSLTLGREEYLAMAEATGIGPPAAPESNGLA